MLSAGGKAHEGFSTAHRKGVAARRKPVAYLFAIYGTVDRSN